MSRVEFERTFVLADGLRRSAQPSKQEPQVVVRNRIIDQLQRPSQI